MFAITALIGVGASLTLLPAALMNGLQAELFQPAGNGAGAIARQGANGRNSGVFDQLTSQVQRLGGAGGIYAVLLAALLLNFVLNRYRYALTTRVIQGVLAELEQKIYSQLLVLGPRFYARISRGEILGMFAMDVMSISGSMQQLLGNVLYNSVVAVVVIVAVIVSGGLVGLAVIAIVLLSLGAYPFIFGKLNKLATMRRMDSARVSDAVQEVVDGHSVLQAYGNEEFWQGRFSRRLNGLVETDVKLGAVSAVIGSLSEITNSLCLGTIVVLLVAFKSVASGVTTDLLGFIFLITRLISALGSLTGVGQAVSSSAAATDRILAIHDELPDVCQADNPVQLGPLKNQIELSHVVFGYSVNAPLFRDLNLRFDAGKHYAIVGGTGSGKSTIANLVQRVWDPNAGSISYDGVDLRDADLSSLRSQMSVMFQRPILFNVSILENIRMGDVSVTDVDVQNAAKASQIHDLIASLPGGYGTIVDESIQFSGGELQRIALARALVRRPSLIILDEATSALDAVVARSVLDAISEIAKGRTVISITHHWTVAERADEIISVVDGEVVEQGTHEQLKSSGGFYQSLYEEQTKPRTSDDPVTLPVKT